MSVQLAGQGSLFAAQDCGSIAEMSERDLLTELCDSAMVSTLGNNERIGAHALARLRGEILTACGELARRWGSDEGRPR